MREFRVTQISDTHLARRLQKPTDNFHRVSEHIDATRPDLVINSGDLAFSAPTSPDDLIFAKALHDALPAPCRHLPGNHDIGDNPTAILPEPAHPVTEPLRQDFIRIIGHDRWRFEEAGWCFIGLNSLIMNSGLASEAEQFDWLAAELGRAHGRPVALFIHKPLFLDAPEDPELESSAVRYVPQPRRQHLIGMFDRVDLRLIASGHIHQRRDVTFGHVRHVWAPSTGFTIPDRIQPDIGVKQTGLIEYRFAPDCFEVRHVKAPGQLDYGMDEVNRKTK